eukprot:TRINITY_DN2095_c0_g1_i2.p1 TRINITY_DN2095_c0_g1~~TRINITY_DN2095_c0_g1_i2.p1  ORF type:complete len:530 (-),score=73.26 TRINITY_DN2095_c0_g1_i2:261-1631(-)
MDLDGKDVFAYGIAPEGSPRRAALSTDTENRKRDALRQNFRWESTKQLLLRAEILKVTNDGKVSLNHDRTVALLVLTAIHDIMKNRALLPTVQPQHAPYQGTKANEVIQDHDFALAYMLEHFPSLLPSFAGLEAAQRAPILFTTSRMNFNNGWLVQGEAPPGLLFSSFKKCIVKGRASEADISFYFVHWLTDLAGSELYQQRPWPGSEKFALKFPQHVLSAFIDSFSFVRQLAHQSEVDVMEDYLKDRWLALGPPVSLVPEGCEVASMRLALMAQGFEADAVAAFAELPEQDRACLACELARTGHSQQFSCAPAEIRNEPAGPALLIYYAPALLQNAKSVGIREALLILCGVLRAAREIFPLDRSPLGVQSHAIIRIDAIKDIMPAEIQKMSPWYLRQTSSTDAVIEKGEAIGPGEIAVEWRSLTIPLSGPRALPKRPPQPLVLRSQNGAREQRNR